MYREYRVAARTRGGVVTRKGADLGRVIAELKSTGHGEVVKIECREITAWRDVPVRPMLSRLWQQAATAMGSGG